MAREKHEGEDRQEASWMPMYIFSAVGLLIAGGILVALFTRERAPVEEPAHEQMEPAPAPEAEAPVEEATEPDAVEPPPPVETEQVEVMDVPGGLTANGIPPVSLEMAEQMEGRFAPDGMQVCGHHPLGGLLVLMSTSGTGQIHHMAAPGQEPVALTGGDAAPGCAVVHGDADGGYFLFARDSGEAGTRDIFMQKFGAGEASALTDGGVNDHVVVDPASGRIAYASNLRSPEAWDIRVMDPADPSTDRVVLEAPSPAGYRPTAWMPNSRHLLVVETAGPDDVKTLLLDTETGSYRPVDLDEQAPCITNLSAVSPEKGFTLGVSDCVKGDHLNLVSVEMKVRYGHPQTRDIPWDVTDLAPSADLSTVAFVVNENGASKLYALQWMEDRWRRKSYDVLPAGVVESMAMDGAGEKLALSLSAFGAEDRLITVDMASGQVQSWSGPPVGDDAPAAPASLVAYPTFDMVDGAPREIPAVMLASGDAGAGPAPVVVLLGDPPAQWTVGDHPFFGPLAQVLRESLGAAVVAPNLRGASGYGQSYARLDDGEKRADVIQDVGALLDWIGQQPDLDESRVAVLGFSRGGTLALASLAKYADRLAGGIVGSPVQDPDLGGSMDGVGVPMLFIQGSDPSLPAPSGEGDQTSWRLEMTDTDPLQAAGDSRTYMVSAMVLFLQEVLGASAPAR